MPSEPLPPQPSDGLLSNPETVHRATQALRRVAFSIVHDRAHADDIVQGAWVEVLHRKRRIPGLGWLRALVRSRSIDVLRRKEREEALLARANAEADRSRHADPLGEEVEVQRAVLEAVDTLEEPYRGTVFLRYFEGIGPAEIARRTDTPRRTVETRLTRAHRILRQRLQHLRSPDGDRWSPVFLTFAATRQEASVLTGLGATLVMKKISTSFVLIATLVIASLGWLLLQWDWAGSPGTTADPTLVPSPGRVDTDTPADVRRVAQVENAAKSAATPTVSRGSLIVRVRGSSGESVGNVHVVATGRTDAWSNKVRFRRRTNKLGVAVFPHLPLGTFVLESDRGRDQETHKVEILAGETREITLSLTEGLHVVGSVRDRSGRPVADADIWLTSPTGGWTSGGVVVRSDSNGRFEVVDVPNGRSLGATAAGFQPSALVDLDHRDPKQDPTRVELVLEPGGARLEGVVYGDGKPLQDVVLALGTVPRLPSARIDGTSRERWGPRATRTDAFGKYTFEGLKPGRTVLRVRAGEFPAWSATVTLEAGKSTQQIVRLVPGGSVVGTATDSSGAAAPGILVHALSEEVSVGNLENGLLRSTSPFHHPCTVTGEGGRFVLTNVRPGRILMVAREQSEEHRRPRAPYRFVRESVQIGSGQTLQWNPSLTDGRVIEGVATYADGTPITKHYIILDGDDPADHRAQRTPDGSFRFLQLPDKPFSVRVQMWVKPEGAREPRLENVRPDSGPIRLTADFAPPRSVEPAEVRIRFVDTAKRAVGDPTAMLELMDRQSWSNGQKRNGGWTFRVEKPGTYRPVIFDGERVIATGDAVTIAGSERLDLGVLRSKAGARLTLRFVRSKEHPPRGVRCALSVNGVQWSEPVTVDARNEQQLDRLEPGPGSLRLIGGNIVNRRIPFHLVAGQNTVVKIELQPAAVVPYRIFWGGAPPGEAMSLKFVDRTDGRVVDEFSTPDLHRYPSPVGWATRLPIGSYALEVDFSTLRDRRVEFEITSLDPKSAPKLLLK